MTDTGHVLIDLVEQTLVVRCGACGDERVASIDAGGVASARAMIGRHAQCSSSAHLVPAV